MDNKHLEAIPTDIIAQVQTKLNEIRTLLLPYATPLTPSERRDPAQNGRKIAHVCGKIVQICA